MIWGGRWEGGSGLGTHVHLRLVHINVWQNQYSIVKQNKVKIKIKKKEKKSENCFSRKKKKGKKLPLVFQGSWRSGFTKDHLIPPSSYSTSSRPIPASGLSYRWPGLEDGLPLFSTVGLSSSSDSGIELPLQEHVCD